MNRRSPFWGNDAIVPVRPTIWPTPRYDFNQRRLGVGLKYRKQPYGNEPPDALLVALDMEIGVAKNYPFWGPVVLKNTTLRCLLDTGAQDSLFDAEVAKELELTPPTRTAGAPGAADYESNKDKGLAFQESLTLAIGQSEAIWWCYRKLCIVQKPLDAEIRVLFPLRPTHDEQNGLQFDWDPDRVKINLLGMSGLLACRMLCVTPEAVWMLARQGV